jgi:hypothetical protein
VLVIWTPEDRVRRPGHGRRLAALLPDAQLVEISDSYTLVMRDQPEAFASSVREFIRGTTGPKPGTAGPQPAPAWDLISEPGGPTAIDAPPPGPFGST